MTVTRLLRGNLVQIGNDAVKAWLEISQGLFEYSKLRKTAGIMMAHITYYCASEILNDKEMYELFADPYIQKYTRPEFPLKNLDATLNAFIYNSPFSIKLAPAQSRPRPNLKGFAKFTVDAIDYPRTITNDENKEDTDIFIARVFCHWDSLLRAINDESFLQECEKYSTIERRRDIIDLCAMMAKPMAWHIRDRDGMLCQAGKHAVMTPCVGLT